MRYAFVLDFTFILGHRKRDFVLEKQSVTHVTNKCDTHEAAFLDLLLLNDIFSKNMVQYCW